MIAGAICLLNSTRSRPQDLLWIVPHCASAWKLPPRSKLGYCGTYLICFPFSGVTVLLCLFSNACLQLFAYILSGFLVVYSKKAIPVVFSPSLTDAKVLMYFDLLSNFFSLHSSVLWEFFRENFWLLYSLFSYILFPLQSIYINIWTKSSFDCFLNSVSGSYN